MSARDAILARLRKRGETATQDYPPVPVTAYDLNIDRGGLIDTFIQQAEHSGAEVLRAATQADADTLLHSLQAGNSDLHVVTAEAGIAETGTLCLHSHHVASRSLFLCEHLVVLLPTSAITASQEDYWHTAKAIPRALHLITGPSRTADVEQTLQIGAHGPRRETIVLVEEQPEA